MTETNAEVQIDWNAVEQSAPILVKVVENPGRFDGSLFSSARRKLVCSIKWAGDNSKIDAAARRLFETDGLLVMNAGAIAIDADKVRLWLMPLLEHIDDAAAKARPELEMLKRHLGIKKVVAKTG